MKARVKAPFYNDSGIHKIGDIIETASIDPFLMEEIADVDKKEPKKVVEEVKKATRKTIKK